MEQKLISIPVWNIESETGYKPLTTFWEDFSIADAFGEDAVTDTFIRAFKEWKNNYKFLTELVIVLNHKIFQWCQVDENLARNYNELYRFANDYAVNNLKGKELEYYYYVTD